MDESLPSKILILDPELASNEEQLELLASQLAHVHVDIVRTVEECLLVLAQREYDVVLVDYDLDDVRRGDFVPKIRLVEPRIQIQFFTRSTEAAVLIDLSRQGNRFMIKDGSWVEVISGSMKPLLKVAKLERSYENLRWKLTAAKQLLEEKNRRLDEFSATVAHDIRGPLGGVIMKVEYILETYEDELDDRIKMLLQRSLDSAQRLTGLVQAMYDFAKIGLRPGTLTTVSVSKLVDEVIADLSIDPALDVRMGVGELPDLEGNSELLRRVFLNLINNAVKYCDKDTIRINIGTERMYENALGKFCELYVEDNGPGIPEEDQTGIFSMFRRGSTTGSEVEGLGIGLSVVQKIVELHFGAITVKSDPAWGTKFLIALPLEKIDFVS